MLTPSPVVASSTPLKVSVEPVTAYDAEMSDVALWDQYMAWAGSDRLGTPATRAQLLDLKTGHIATLARSADGQEIGWVRGDRNTVTYTSIHTTTDSAGVDHYRWAIHVLTVGGGDDRIVDTSDTPASRMHLTSPSLSWPWLIWDKAVTNDRWAVEAFNVSTGERLRPITSEDAQDPMVDNGKVYWIRNRAGSADVMYTTIKSGTRVSLTTTGRVSRLYARAGHLAYTEVGVDGRPNAVWRMDEPSLKPVLVAKTEAYGVVAGADFTAWLSNSDDIVMQLTGERPRILTRKLASVIARLFATPHRLAYGTVTYDSSSLVKSQALHYVNVD